MEDIPLIVSLVTGVISVTLAGFAIWLSKSNERESRENFEETRNLLAEIDKRATVTEKTVAESQQQLLNTVTSLLSQTVPTKPDIGEKLGMEFFKAILTDPTKGKEIAATMNNLKAAFEGEVTQD